MSDDLKKQQDEKLEKYRETARAYRRLFATEDGKTVLEDLKRIFGYGKPSARVGMRNEEVWLAEGMKMPLFRVDDMLTANLDKPQKKEAKR